MTLISPGDCTLQCGMWLWHHDSEFTKWQHPAVWYVALGWHAVEFARWQHPAMWQVALGWHAIESPKRLPYWNSTSGFDAVDMSFCTSLCKILSNLDHPRQKKMTSCRFSRWRISAILDFRGPIMGSLKSPCTISYRSLIETIALNCLVFEKIAFLQFGDRQTNTRTDGHAHCMKPLSLSQAAAYKCGFSFKSLSSLEL